MTQTPTLLPLKPDLTAAELTLLSQSPDTGLREAVARHPNTPPEVLGVLGEYHPQAVLDNPALTLLRLAHPGLLGSWSGETVAQLTALPDAPIWVQDAALRHRELPPRLAVAERVDLSEQHLRNLACNAEWQLREAMARRRELGSDLVEMLALDDDYDVRKAVAARELLPTHLLERLAAALRTS
jgi:Leucine rich repeat variant